MYRCTDFNSQSNLAKLRILSTNHEIHLRIAITPPINTTRPTKTKGAVMKLSAAIPAEIKVNPAINTTTKDAIEA